MIILVLKNNYLVLCSEDENLLENVYDALTFNDTSKAFSYYKGFDKDKVKKVRFAKFIDDLDLPSLRIPIGFEYFIKSVLKDYEYEVIDDRPKLEHLDISDISLDGIELWEHQIEEINGALNNRRGIIKAPPGSGKTESFLIILQMLKDPSLVLFNRIQLARQAMARAKSRGLDVGIVQGENVIEAHITMATIQSIEKIERLSKYKNLLLDECFPPKTKILTEHGYKNISTICKNKLTPRVYSFNIESRRYELKRVYDWFIKSKKSRELIYITLSNKKYSFSCTKNHKIFNSNLQKIEAEKITIGTKLFIKSNNGENKYSVLKVVDIKTKIVNKNVYNISVKDNHNYLISKAGILVGNCHNCSSREYQNVIKLKHWMRIYGFSATPFDPSKFTLKTAKIVANIGNIIIEIKPKILIEKKIIAKPRVIFIPVTQPDDIWEFTYQEAEQVSIVNNKYRNNLVRKLVEHHQGEKILILSKYVKQGEQIAELLNAPFIWNKVKVKKRMEVVEEFDNGNTDILVASRILDEGIDIKNFTVLIIASAGKSFEKTIQRLGRGLRVTKKKKNVTVYDFWDDTHHVLLKHSKIRKKDYISSGYEDILNIKNKEDIELYLSL